MKVFFDTEFTGLQKDTDLISIGLVSENGKCFYGEFTDYDNKKCDEWIRQNVISQTLMGNKELSIYAVSDYHVGNKETMGIMLYNWLSQFEVVELVSDVCHYDMVLFCDIFGGAFNLPKNVAPYCHDITDDIQRYYEISYQEAFDLDRETIIPLTKSSEKEKISKHNSLYDAIMIRCIYEYLNMKLIEKYVKENQNE